MERNRKGKFDVKKDLINKRASTTRWLLLIGVLSAMFFSHGEGISLLPFSHSQDSSGSAAESAKNRLDSYVFSVHRSGSQRNSPVSKFQKNPKNFSLLPASLNFSPREAIQNPSAASGQNFGEADFFALSGVLSRPSARAPPLV